MFRLCVVPLIHKYLCTGKYVFSLRKPGKRTNFLYFQWLSSEHIRETTVDSIRRLRLGSLIATYRCVLFHFYIDVERFHIRMNVQLVNIETQIIKKMYEKKQILEG